MRKRVFALLCAALMIWTIGGCGVQEPEETTPPTEPEPVTVEVPYVPQQTVKKYEGVALRLATPLSAQSPEGQVMARAGSYFETVTGAQVQILWETAAGTADCDMFQTGNETLHSSFAAASADLSAMAAEAGYESKSFFGLRQLAASADGRLLGIPYLPEITGVYYLTDAFADAGVAEIPGTWEAFLTACEKLQTAGYVPLALNKEAAPLAAWLHLERSLGGEKLAALKAEKGGCAGEAALLDAAQQILDLVKGENVLTAAFPGGQNKLALSNAAMTVGTNSLCPQVEADACMDGNWGVFPWPGAGQGSGCGIAAEVLCVHSGSKQPQAAFDFILLLCSGEFDQLRADLTGGIPADPANGSAIAGAAALLEKTGNQPETLDEDVCLKLWTGKYKTGLQFAKALDKTR